MLKTKIIAGNWKMNGLAAALDEIRQLRESTGSLPQAVRVAVMPPATLIHSMAEAVKGSVIAVGGQDCHPKDSGAHTGDISAAMLRDAGATLVIVGHSERRTDHGEDNATVAAKTEAALRTGLEPVICVGETLAQREAGDTLAIIARQVAESLPDALDGRAFAVAYEPVWAIGTGLTPTLEQIAEVHGAIRRQLTERFSNGASVPVLYGGSVKPNNAEEILALEDVGGALVGGASLKAADFSVIINAATASVPA
ncbi:MAG: triose-phosphate isomerase [Asticcacaulis sp.]